MIKAIETRRIFFLFAVFLCLAPVAFGQTCKGPILKDRLVIALKSKMQNAQQLAAYINQCGVNFQVTPDVEAELIAAGARPQVIEAARNNFRGSTVNKNTPQNVNNKSSANAVTKAALLKTIKAKSMTNGALLDMIETNGVNFQTTAAVEKELTAAGASPAIIAAVKTAYRGGNNASLGNAGNTPVKPSVAYYDDLVEQAIDSYNRDVNSNLPAGSAGRVQAIETLNKAITMQPNNPTAYQQLGFMTLYGTMNGFTAAENNFKKAIELGGSAVLRVFHDHDGVFNDTCNGSLYVSRDGVRFESDDNRHTFDTTDANIKQVKTNSSWRRAFQIKSGSFKIILNDQTDKDGKKFSFAPLTDNIEESKMVIRLIGKN